MIVIVSHVGFQVRVGEDGDSPLLGSFVFASVSSSGAMLIFDARMEQTRSRQARYVSLILMSPLISPFAFVGYHLS